MKKICITTFKLTALSIIITASYLALTAQYDDNQWDPVKEIQQLKNQHRRDDAIDLVNFLKENQTHSTDEMSKLQKEVAYSPLERAKAFVWDGAVKGNVNDTYSGIGAWLLISVSMAISVTLPNKPGICYSTRKTSMGWSVFFPGPALLYQPCQFLMDCTR